MADPQKRAVNATLTAVNGASSAITLVTTNDDDIDRHLVGILMSGQAAGAVLQLYKAGKVIATFDGTQFSAARGPIPLYEYYKVGYYFTIQLVNASGGNIANAPVQLVYEIQRQ